MIRNLIYFVLLFLIAACYIFIANTLPIFQWDESRLGVNAIEMLKNKAFLVTTYLNQPDNWNSKPPFVIWLMSSSIHINGLSELSARIPSILFSILTIVVVNYILIKEKIFNSYIPILFAIVTFTSIGFSGYHVAITADYDATLTFFSSISILSFFFWVEKIRLGSPLARNYAILFFTCITLGILTKGVVILIFSPVLFLYFIVKVRFQYLISKENVFNLITLLTAIIIVFSYYYIRNKVSPEYFQSVINNELWGRYSSSIEQHIHPASFYFLNILKGRFSIFIYFIFLSPLIYFNRFNSDKRIQDFTFLLLANVIFFLLVISSAKTKLEWYDAPVYPLFSVVVCIVIICIWNYFDIEKWIKATTVLLLIGWSLSSIGNYYSNLIMTSWHPKDKLSIVIKKGLTVYDLKSPIVITENYQPHFDFYKYLFENKGKNLSRNDYEYLPLNLYDTLLISDEFTKIRISKFYNILMLDSSEAGYIIKSNGFNSDSILSYYKVKRSEILNNREWYNQIVDKAKTQNISIDDQIRNDIIYVSEKYDHLLTKEMRYYLVNSL